MTASRLAVRFALAPLCLLLLLRPAGAGPADDFFRNATVSLIVGAAAGTSYDSYARLIATHLPQHLPGHVTLVPRNMPAAGSITALNHLYTVAARDGSVIGCVNPGAVMAGLLDPETAKYDPRRFGWLGSIARETEVIALRGDAPVQSFSDAFRTEVMVGGTGGAASVLPAMLNGILGTKFKVINGYTGSTEVFLAMERGEVAGIGSSSLTQLNNSQTQALASGKLRIIAQYGLSKDATLPNVPTVLEYVQSPEQRQAFELVLARQELGRVYLTPPELPAPILAAYRQAFAATMADEKFRADVKAHKLDYDPQPGDSLATLIAHAYNVPAPVVARVREVLGSRLN